METIIDAGAGIVKCAHRKMAIIGAGPGRARAPWDDPTWCFQALNEIWQPRFERHWELHPIRVQSPRDLAFLAACPTPCYVLDLQEANGAGRRDARGPVVTNAVQYPLDRLKTAGLRADYFTCTFAYQIALALLDGFEAIGLWGVELYDGTPRERLVERACVEYWLGVADGRGVRVEEAARLAWQPFLYGYDYDKEKGYIESEVAALRRAIDEDALRRAHGRDD